MTEKGDAPTIGGGAGASFDELGGVTGKFVEYMQKIQFVYVNRARIRFRNQPVLSNEGKVSCSRKQWWEPLVMFKLTTDRLRVRHSTHCLTRTSNYIIGLF